MQTPDRIGRLKLYAAAGAFGLLVGMWAWHPSTHAASDRYDVAITASQTLRLERAGAVDQVASAPNRTLACVSVMRLGLFDAGLKCVALSAGMSARTAQAERRSY